MAGKPNTRWMESMIAKYGSREAVSEHMANNGKKGGQRGRTGGFFGNRELASEAGRKGGQISRRPSAKRITE